MLKLDIQMFARPKLVIETDLDKKGFEKGLDRMQNASKKAGETIKNIVAGLGITAVISKGINMITSSVDDAVARVDILNNFPKVMSNLGIATDESQKAIDKMSKKLAGLPTTLDQGASAVQRFTSKNNNVKKSTDIFLALNNAILAGGASSEIQSSALEQLSQSYAKGKPDMMEWRAAMTAMPAQLKQVATAMGYVNADELGEALREGSVSMDEFMDTIVRLNKEGTGEFASFEKQARNSTAGIGTAITVAKTQVVKGVADIITGINKSLKKSNLPSLGDLIADVGKRMKTELDKIAKLVSKIDFRKLFNTIKKLIPIVGTLTAGFIAYNASLKALVIAKSIKNFAKLTSTFLTSIPALKGANLAMIKLNATMMISPIGLLVAGVAGLTAGLYLLNKASASNRTEQQKLNDTLRDYDKAMKEADKSRQAYLDKHMNEIQNTENLYNELQALVDENGKVKEGYEDRVNYILGELNSALGIEMKMTDGVIDNYKEMKQSIDDVIQSKRAKVLLDAQEEKYNEAKDQAVKLEQNYANAQRDYNSNLSKRSKILKDIQNTYGLTNKQLQEVATTLSYTDKNGQKVNLSFDKLSKQLTVTNANLTTSKNTLDKAGKAYADNQKFIGNYEQALKELAEGNYNAVLKMYEDTTNYQGKTNEETQKKYDSAIQSQKAYLDYLKQNRGAYNDEVYQKEVNATNQRIKNLEDEQKRANATVATGQSIVKTTWNNALAQQLSEITGKNIQFEKTGNGQIQAYINGQKQGAPMTKAQAKKMAEDMKAEINKAKKGSKQAGIDFTTGTTQGIRSGQGSTFNAVVNYGASILARFKKALKEKSPSKATREMGIFFDEGFDEGVEQGSKNSIKTVKDYGEDLLDEFNSINYDKTIDNMYKSMQHAIDLEQEKLVASVETGRVFNTIQNSTPVAININGDVNMDGQKVGRLVTPTVTRTIKNGGGI